MKPIRQATAPILTFRGHCREYDDLRPVPSTDRGEAMERLLDVSVAGLFGAPGSLPVHLSSDDPVTIITGPNGSGKTHLLRLIYAAANLDMKTLANTYFASIELSFYGGAKLRIEKNDAPDDIAFEISGVYRGVPRAPYKFGYAEALRQRDLPDWLHPLPDGTWIDGRDGEVISKDAFYRRYRINLDLQRLQIPKPHAWINEVLSRPTAILIDTQRLDSTPIRHGSNDYSRRRPPEPVEARITQYIEQLKNHIVEARRESLNASQAADQSFAARVMEKARTNVNGDELKQRYQAIAEQHAELYDNGLGVRPVDVKFPVGRTNETQRRILNVFLDDWEKKLEPLKLMNAKLKALRGIIDNKLIGKSLRVDEQGNVGFVSVPSNSPLPVSLLSSGEQHLLAIFTLLLFSAERGSLVLIDEPEISMHAAWKHSFVSDVTQVALINNLQIVLATHSSSIINGRWDLEQVMGGEVD